MKENKILISALIAVIVIGLGLIVYFQADDSSEVTPTAINVSAQPTEEKGPGLPMFILQDLDGVTHASYDFSGAPLLAVSWTTDCTACIDFFTRLASLKDAYGERLHIILLNHAQEQDAIQDYLGDNEQLKSLIYLVDTEDSYRTELEWDSEFSVAVFSEESVLIQQWDELPDIDAVERYIEDITPDPAEEAEE